MKIRNLIISFTALLAIVGCLEDKGNYNYTVLPKIYVSLPSFPSILTGEKVTYIPKLEVPKGYESTYEYEWRVDDKYVAAGPTFEYTGVEIGSHYIAVTATDTKTGAKIFGYVTLIVASEFEKGFLILAEDGNNTEMHFVRVSKIYGDYQLNTNDTLVFMPERMNIYKDIIGEPIVGKPVQVTEHWTWEAYIDGELTVETIVDGKSKFSEYNGTTMKRETFIEQEFENEELPENFSPKQVTHSCWDSFILNEDGFIYPRRVASSTSFHTGTFDRRNKLWGNAKFSDLLFAHYKYCYMFLAVEIDPITNKRNFVGIYENQGSSNIETQSSKKLVQSGDLNPDFSDVKGEILFNDYFRFTGDSYNPVGMNAFIIKNESGEYVLQIAEFKNGNKEFVYFTSGCKKINLTTTHSISKINGMFTSKSRPDRVVYFYDDNTVYFYNNKTGEFGTVVTYENKTIAAAAGQMNVQFDGDEDDANDYEAHVMVGFSDGTLEVMELDNLNPTKSNKIVFRSTNNLGIIKQIIYKLGNDSEFTY